MCSRERSLVDHAVTEERTLLLTTPSSAPPEVEGTLLLEAQPRGAADDMEATLFMAQRERASAGAPAPEPIEATMVLSAAATADDGASSTLALTMDAASFAERGGTSVVSQPAPRAAPWAPATPLGHAPGQPAPLPSAPFAPPVADPRAVAPQGSRLGPLILILALIAAVAGVVVGLLLGDG